MSGVRTVRYLLLLGGLVACSSSTVNCGPCGPAVEVLVNGLPMNTPVLACLPDVGAGSSCVTVTMTKAAKGSRWCHVVDVDGSPTANASCDVPSSAGTAYLIDHRQQRPSAYRGKLVTLGRAAGRFEVTEGRGPCGCDSATASVDFAS